MSIELQVGSITFENHPPYCLDCLQPVDNHLSGCKLKTTEKLQNNVDVVIDKIFKSVEDQTKLLRMWMDKYQTLLEENSALLKCLEKYEKL